MRYAFHPEARLEYREATEFHAAIRPEMGAEFTREIEAVIEQICDDPLRCRIIEQDVRRCLARRVPYAVLYTLEEDHVLILAVMHGSRQPGYWRSRIDHGA